MSTPNPILAAGSKDVKRKTHLEKIKLLEEELLRLTILENPLEISIICKSIIDIKKNLEKVGADTPVPVKKG